ncbi:MAG: hypothetical protein NZM42_15260, partial [Gemmatales bacterium]|nr:hypothetical protein [Gemmatales bacterium]
MEYSHARANGDVRDQRHLLSETADDNYSGAKSVKVYSIAAYYLIAYSRFESQGGRERLRLIADPLDKISLHASVPLIGWKPEFNLIIITILPTALFRGIIPYFNGTPASFQKVFHTDRLGLGTKIQVNANQVIFPGYVPVGMIEYSVAIIIVPIEADTNAGII